MLSQYDEKTVPQIVFLNHAALLSQQFTIFPLSKKQYEHNFTILVSTMTNGSYGEKSLRYL